MRPLFYLLTITVLFFSCKEDNVKPESTVEIYLLKNYKLLSGKCQIDSSASDLQDVAIVRNQDIVQYSKSDYQFRLTDVAIQKIKDLSDKTPFAVTVNKKVIYYGIFKPSFSSSSCGNSITMDVYLSGNKIALNLGYPGSIQGMPIDDQRNHANLLGALKNQGKLK